MVINNNGGSNNTDAISALIDQVMNKFDTNADGQLSGTEFKSFLSGLIGGTALTGTATSGRLAAETQTPGAFRDYMSGFNFYKLDNPGMADHDEIKYKAARVFQNYKPMPESLPAVVADLQAQGINARQVAFDKIDFNDGWGPIDVIQGAYPGGGVAWMWLPDHMLSHT
jgi:hypothetical protein